jgi:hypothetical protein
MTPVAAPSIVTRTADGKILAVMPLKPVPAPGCTHWNTCIQRRKG